MRLIRFATSNATHLCKATEKSLFITSLFENSWWMNKSWGKGSATKVCKAYYTYSIVLMFQFWHLLRENQEWIRHGKGSPQPSEVKSLDKTLFGVTNGLKSFVEGCFKFQMYFYCNLQMTWTRAIIPILKATPTIWRFLPLLDPQVEVTFYWISPPRWIIHINVSQQQSNTSTTTGGDR